MRISVIGLPGSGKSTLAENISRKFSIPHIHLDRFWFEAGGKTGAKDTPNLEVVRAHVRERALAAIQGESWVSDGLYGVIQNEIADRADTLIFLDISLPRRILNHFARIFDRKKRHAEVTLWQDVKFFSEIIRRTFSNKQKIRTITEKYKHKILILRSRKEIDAYLSAH